MEMRGQERIAASRETVWAALNDPEILRRCIPGCEELVRQSDTEMTAVAVIKVGPIKASFTGAVILSELDPPNGYRITGEGQGGIAGHARGGAVVRLEADGNDTLLSYEVSAQVGGKLAQLGARMIDATARSLAAAFFRKFAAEIAGPQILDTAGAAVAPVRSVPRSALSTYGHGQPQAAGKWIWLFAGIVLGMIAMAVFAAQAGEGITLVHVLLGILGGFVAARLRGQAITVIVEQPTEPKI